VLILVLLTGFLAVARITRLLVEDKVTVRLRRWVIRRWGEESLPAYFIHCPWCMSFWVGLVIMPIAVAWPNRWMLGAFAVLASSYITGILAAREERS